MALRKLKIGDVIEIVTPKGSAFAQYTHHHQRLGALIRVLPGIYSEPPSDLSAIVASKERFHVFFPLQAAFSQGIVKFVGQCEVPPNARTFPLLRMPGCVDKSGRVLDWWLFDGNREWRVGKLNPAHLELSLAGIWNDTMLINRIASGWEPRIETGEPKLPASSSAVEAHEAKPATLSHYIYFPREADARRAEAALKNPDFVVESRPSGDQWLIRLTHRGTPAPQDVTVARERLEQLSARLGGEYDGWETGIPDKTGTFQGRLARGSARSRRRKGVSTHRG